MRTRASLLSAFGLAVLALLGCGGRTGVLLDGAPSASQGGAGTGVAGGVSQGRAGSGGDPNAAAGQGGGGGSAAVAGEGGGGAAGGSAAPGAHFFAYTQFLSSSSTRASAHLLDLNNGATFTLLDDTVSALHFSPDGRWVGFCNAAGPKAGEVFVVSTAGDLPGPNLPLAGTAELSACAAYAWAPDGKRVAYLQKQGKENQLWVADTSGNIPSNRRLFMGSVNPDGLAWPRSDVLFFQDTQGRPNVFTFVGTSAALRTVIDIPGAGLLSLAPTGTVAFARHSPDFLLVDTETGAFNVIGLRPVWEVAPSFEFAVGRTPGERLEVYRLKQTKLGGSVRSSPATASGVAAFATHLPAFVELMSDYLDISTVLPGEIRLNLVQGPHGTPLEVRFAEGDESVVFSTESGVWTSRWREALVNPARQLVATTTPADFSLAPDGKRLIVGGGKPYVVSFTSLDPKEKPYNLQVDLLWSEVAWSSDSERVAVIGGSTQLGRALYVTKIAELGKGVPQLVSSCNAIGNTPVCPNQFEFQP